MGSPVPPPYWWLRGCRTTHTWRCTRWRTVRRTQDTWWYTSAGLKEHVTALRSWASTVAGAEIRLHDHPAISPGDTRALSVDQLTHSHPDVLQRPQRGVAQPHRILLDPGGLGTHLL